MSLLYKLWQSDLIICAIIAAVWLSAFIRHPAIRHNPEALWTWPFVREARDAAILIGLIALVLAPVPLAGGYYSIEAAMPAGLAYYYAHEWLAAEGREERGIVALVGIFGELAILAVIWPVTFLPVLVIALFVGAGCWLAGWRVR
jgi:hypothetical protein